ncbi:TonB-dependent receptor [Chitinophaga silvatica]|uniref:TonB-dependent receptor n=1 Tax=Chitinophaga silvatica TaxID=2282649 RepID=A0A3E1YHX7_9BACT|nr:TonB-dependent receptor [Chitinophaga silvatica]RFS26958.1 TonB-dependent receptor [Chitinophaga silvatica]
MNQIYRRYILIPILLLAVLTSASAADILSAVKGKVITSDGAPAAYVTVRIKNTNHGALTDAKGEFVIKRVKPGQYTLEASYLGYETIHQEVVVETDKITQVQLQLNATGQQMKEFTVVGEHKRYNAGTVSNSLRLQSPIVEVPQNIQEVTKDVLADQQVFDMQEGVTRNVSGAQRIGHWDMYTRINVRGSQITAFRNGMNIVSSQWSPLAEDMSMVDRIEFVKGPAGFMLSNGEPGGLYNVVTKKPTGTQQGEVGLTLGSYDTYRATLDLDGKLSKDGKLLYRFNIMGQLKNGHRDYEYTNRYSIAPVLKYLIDDKSSVTVEYDLQYMQLPVIGGNYSFSKKGYGDLPKNFTSIEPNMTPTNIYDHSLMVMFDHQFNQDWKLTAQAGYFRYNQIGQSMWPKGFTTPGNDSLVQRNLSIWDALGVNRSGQVFVNGKFFTGSLTHKVLAGLDMKYSDYFADWNQAATLGDSTFNIYKPVYGGITMPIWDRSRNIRERGVQYTLGYNALYLQDEIGLLDDKLRVTLAGRYTTNKYVNPYEGSYTDSKFTPRLGLSYSIDKHTAVYFIYDVFFMANPGLDYLKRNFKPLTGDNLEVGLKRDWWNGRVSSTISVYQMVKNNVQTADQDHPDPVTNNPIYMRTNGQQKIKGVEVDVQGEIVKNLNLVVNYAYTDAIVSKDEQKEFVGNAVAGTARHIQNSWLSYTLGNSPLKGLRASVGYQYMAGRVAGMVYDKSENPLPDYFRLDAGLGYQINKINVNVLVNNLLDAYLYTGAPSGGYYYWQTEPGRNVRLNVGYRF